MNKKIKFLGIDIGGAHVKYVGLNKNNCVNFVKYSECPLWKGLENLKKEIRFINDFFDKSVVIGITMTAELCDIFKNRHDGGKLIVKICNNLSQKKFYYTKSAKVFCENPLISNIISMNWHSIGKLIETKFKNALIVDFVSTTTDFICVKNFKIQNKNFNDFSRLRNHELLYTGLTRTPIIGIQKNFFVKGKEYKVIPEFFATMSDVYRIKNKISTEIDIDETADKRQKTLEQSLIRLSRNIGFDYQKKKIKELEEIASTIKNIQLENIFKNIELNFKNFNLKRNTNIILSGIGQDILKEFLEKKIRVMQLKSLIEAENEKIKKKSSYHAPALSIAILLSVLK